MRAEKNGHAYASLYNFPSKSRTWSVNDGSAFASVRLLWGSVPGAVLLRAIDGTTGAFLIQTR